MTWTGIYRGVVRSTMDPQKTGRVRLQVPQVTGAALTGWVPPAQVGGAAPTVGQQVWVMYEGGDVSYPTFIPPIPVSLYPMSTEQVSEPDYATTGAFVPFTADQWAPISFVVPPSGLFRVTVGARISNTATTTSTAWATWRIEGDVASGPNTKWGVSTAGSARQQASHLYLVKTVPAGSSITIRPCWNISSFVSGATQVTSGQLIVEPIGNQ